MGHTYTNTRAHKRFSIFSQIILCVCPFRRSFYGHKFRKKIEKRSHTFSINLCAIKYSSIHSFTHTAQEAKRPTRAHFYFSISISHTPSEICIKGLVVNQSVGRSVSRSIGMESGYRWKLPLDSKLQRRSIALYLILYWLPSRCVLVSFPSLFLSLNALFTCDAH